MIHQHRKVVESSRVKFRVSISSTFYEQLFSTKVFLKAFLFHFGFVIFCRKFINAKTGWQMLVKLTKVCLVRFPQIL